MSASVGVIIQYPLYGLKILTLQCNFQQLNYKTFILCCTMLVSLSAFAQPPQFSLATDFTVIHSFRKNQRFWTIGQSILTHIHFTPRDGMYVLFTYSGKGKFTNRLEARAKDLQTTPQQQMFTNRVHMTYDHLSLGWKHYLVGNSHSEYQWNLYGYAGFGLMFGEVNNSQSPGIDTSVFNSPVMAGPSSFKRLTLDLGLGYEIPIGGGVNFYMEARALVPTTDYPSRYLLTNEDAPFTGSANLGIRFLFD